MGTTLIFIFVLGIPLCIFGAIALKRSKNAKLCKAGYYCIFRGPDEAWGEVLECKNNILQAPAGKKRKKGLPEHKWPTGGYQVPTDMKIPYIMYPLEASSHTQYPIGVLIFDIGNPTPLNYKGASEMSPEVLESINENNLAIKIFKDWSEMLGEGEAQQKASHGNMVLYIALIGIIGCLIMCVISYIAQMSISNDLETFMEAFGVK